MNRVSLRVLAVGAIAVGVATACSSSNKSSAPPTTAASSATTAGSTGATTGGTTAGAVANTASAPGITATTIKIGLITSETGNASSTFSDSGFGATARFDAVNAAGGINGRKITLVEADDTSSPAGDLAAAQSLVSKGVFAIIDYTPYAFGGYKYLQAQGIPVTGGAFDGPEWGIQPNTNMFTYGGALDPTEPANTQDGLFFKSVGATNVAGFAYGVSPSSTDSIKDLKESLASQGIKMGYENLSVPFGAFDFSTYALQMKSAGVDGATCSCVQSSNIAMAVAAKQAGINLKGALMFSGADGSLFQSATATAAAQGTYWPTTIVPIDLNNPATTSFLNNLKAVDPSYKGGYPSYGLTGTYLSADLMLEGLKVAGQNPTRQSFITNMQKVTAWNAEGLLPNTVGFNHFGHVQSTLCGYFEKVEGNQFVTINGGKPICGNLIPNSAVASIP
jgi:branched-chain amino acid transport system substrate-binding protein